MFHENAFQTGKILDKGETEVGIHLPLNATVAHGLLESDFEFRGFAGYSGWNTGGIGIAMGKAITKGDLFFTSGTADAELFLTLDITLQVCVLQVLMQSATILKIGLVSMFH